MNEWHKTGCPGGLYRFLELGIGFLAKTIHSYNLIPILFQAVQVHKAFKEPAIDQRSDL